MFQCEQFAGTVNPALNEDQRARLQLAHSLIKKGDEESLGYLKSFLEDGGDANVCLGVAVSNFSLESTKILLEYGANPNFVARYGSPALHIVTKYAGHMELFLLLLDSGADINVKFVDACGPNRGNYLAAEVLIKAGANPDAAMGNGRTTLHLAAMRNSYKVAKVLIQHGCNIDAIGSENNEHKTALMHAIDRNHIVMVRLLISAWADVSNRDRLDCSPLSVAIFNQKMEMCLLLIQAGADVSELKCIGNKPVEYYIRNHIGTGVLLEWLNSPDSRLRAMKVSPDPFYQHLEEDPDFLEKLIIFAKNPRPLTLLCRTAILNELGKDPSKKIDRLPTADSVKMFL